MEIFNTDQGSQFSSTDFTKVLKSAEIAISMDGKGAWRDNVIVERLWRTVEYEEAYLRAYASVTQARVSIGRYGLLQRQEAPFVAWRENSGSGIHHRADGNPGGGLKWAAEPLRNLLIAVQGRFDHARSPGFAGTGPDGLALD